jgi:hypothetical protein
MPHMKARRAGAVANLSSIVARGDQRKAVRPCRGDPLHGLSVHQSERGPRDLAPGDDPVQRAAERAGPGPGSARAG